MKQPPKIASWLLTRLGCAPDNDAILGDLAERFQEGKPASWYWNQTLIAIAVSAFEGIREQRIQVLRVAIVGTFVSVCIEAYVAHYLPLVPYWIPLDWWGSEALRTVFKCLVGSTVHLSLTCVSGWTIVRLYFKMESYMDSPNSTDV
jgi:hypothetical protein